MLVAKPSIRTTLQPKRASFNQRIVDQPWKLTLRVPSRNVSFASLNLFRLSEKDPRTFFSSAKHADESGPPVTRRLDITSDPEAASIPSDLFGRAATERS